MNRPINSMRTRAMLLCKRQEREEVKGGEKKDKEEERRKRGRRGKPKEGRKEEERREKLGTRETSHRSCNTCTNAK